MIRRLILGPGSMGIFIMAGVLSELDLSHIEEIAGSSSGGLLAFLFIITHGNCSELTKIILNFDIQKILYSGSFFRLFTRYGYISQDAIKKELRKVCKQYTGLSNPSFDDLYSFNKIKLHIPAFCLDTLETEYFQGSTPVIDIIVATMTFPLGIEVATINGRSYIDGATTESMAGRPFMNKKDVLALVFDFSKIKKCRNIFDFLSNCMFIQLNLRKEYDIKTFKIDVSGFALYKFTASRRQKMKMIEYGRQQCKDVV